MNKPPVFPLNAYVTFNGIKIRVVKRYFDIDTNKYWYKLSLIQELQPEEVIKLHQEYTLNLTKSHSQNVV